MRARAEGAARMVAETGAEPSGTERGADVQVESRLKLEPAEAADADRAASGAPEHEDVRAGVGGEHGFIVRRSGR
jgi:hypothetical protein